MSTAEAPRVGVVIATHNRPQLVREAIESVRTQRYNGQVEVIVVFDRSDPDLSLANADPDRPVVVCTNERTPGLAGARNTGILRLDTEIVAFCDDDDTWVEGKLAKQIERLQSSAGANFVTTSMRVDYQGEHTVRLAGQPTVTVLDMARSRMSMLHSSSFLFRRAAMVDEDGFGLVDETMPRSMGEDWDLLIRAARQHPIAHIDEPLVEVLWGTTSYFSDVWADKNAACYWLIDHHPEVRNDPKALGLQLGKLAFGHAALGERRQAFRAALRALRTNWREPRTVIAMLVLVGVPSEWIVTQLNRRGHGI